RLSRGGGSGRQEGGITCTRRVWRILAGPGVRSVGSWSMGRAGAYWFGMAIAAMLWSSGPAAAQQKEVLIGMQCDRTGATQITGVVLCPAMHDYYALINAAGGIEGYKIKADEIDNEYKVPQAVEAYQRQKQEGAVLMTLY